MNPVVADLRNASAEFSGCNLKLNSGGKNWSEPQIGIGCRYMFRIYSCLSLIFMFTGSIYSAACGSMPTFLVVGCKASTDSATETCATDSTTLTNNKFELTGYFKLDPTSTFACSSAMGNPASVVPTAYSVVTSLHFGTTNYIAVAIRPSGTANEYIASVLKFDGTYVIETVLGTLTSNAGFVQICKFVTDSRWEFCSYR